MNIFAAITPDTVDVWTAVALRVVEAVGLVAVAGVTVWQRVRTVAIAERVDRQGEKISEIQSNVTNLALATPSPGASPAAPSVRLDHAALAKTLAPLVAAAMTANSPTKWPPPAVDLPKKTQ